MRYRRNGRSKAATGYGDHGQDRDQEQQRMNQKSAGDCDDQEHCGKQKKHGLLRWVFPVLPGRKHGYAPLRTAVRFRTYAVTPR